MTRHTLFAAVLAVTGCGEVETARWTIDFSSSSDREDAVVVVAQVLEGGCDGTPYGDQVLVRAGFEGAGLPDPVLPPDRYGFSAQGRDERCVVVAQGCAQVRLPGSSHIETVLEHVEPAVSACPAEQCLAGACFDD